MLRRIVSFCVLGTLSVAMTAAQQKLTMTIEQAVETGLANSKALHTSQFKLEAADAKASEIRTLGLPSVKFNGTYTRLSDVPPQAIILPANSFGPGFPPSNVAMTLSPTILNNYALRATLQQPLFTGGKISGAIDAAEEIAAASKQDLQKDRADVIYNITAAYWNLYRANEFKRFVDENVMQIQAHATDAENLLKQGLVTTNDLMKVQVQLSDALVRQIDADNNVKLSMYVLNNTIGLPLQTEIALASTIRPADRTWDSVDQLVLQALEKRPEVLGMNARVRASEASLTSVHGGWWPQIFLVGNYSYLNPNSRYFPITMASGSAARLRARQAQLAQAREGLSMMKDGITLEVTESYLAIQKSKEREAVSQRGVAQAEENYRIMNGKYVQGLVANSELLDAEVALLQARLNLAQSSVDYELAIAQLSKAIGE